MVSYLSVNELSVRMAGESDHRVKGQRRDTNCSRPQPRHLNYI